MTALRPQQMRELADDSDWLAKSFGISKNAAIADALRSAAEQLEASVSHYGIRRAVKNWWLEGTSNEDELISRIFTADAAPQEGRDA